MKRDKFKELFFGKTLSVIKENINKSNIKDEIFTFELIDEDGNKLQINNVTDENGRIEVELKKDKYDESLDIMMDYFINVELYETCSIN